MSTVPDRLRRLREEKGIGSGAELARLASVPEATYRAYESGRRPLTPRAARQLAEPLGITWQALLFGEERSESGAAPVTMEEAAAALGQRVSRKEALPARPSTPAKDGGSALSLGSHQGEVVTWHGQSFAIVPVYDTRASAGPGAEARDLIVSWISFREDWLRRVSRSPIDQIAVIEIDGNSMEPTLRQGDTVLVDLGQTNPQRKDGIYIIRTDGGLQVKRVSAHPVTGRITIVSDNRELYPTYENISPEDVVVLGRVIWVGRQIGA